MADEVNGRAPSRQTIVVVLSTLIGAALLFALWFLLIRTPYAPAFTGINSADALTITQELDRMKTPYELADEGATILVPQDRVDAARINILGGELPLKGAVGFELFNNSDMGLTDFAQKINYQRALQGELARTIMALEEVETARVHLSLPEAGIFERDRRPAKASITVATKLGGPVDDKVVNGIQQLVASAVPDLSVSNVAVLDARGELLSAAMNNAEPVASSPEQQQRQIFERSTASQIEDALRSTGLSMPMAVKVVALGDFSLAADTGNSQESSETAAANTVSAATEKRVFPMAVEIALATEPGSALREKIQGVANEAIGYDPDLGDTVLIKTDPALANPAPLMPPSKRTQSSSTHAKPLPVTSIIPIWLSGLAGLFVPIVAIVFVMRRRAAKPLSLNEREAFTEKLRNLIDKEMKSDSTLS